MVTGIADCAAESSPWSPRETELLAVTLRLLQQHGYDRLTLDAVAATARASKATVYRRWPSKGELVLAAFIEGIRQVAVPPETGTLRGDLLRLGERICEQARQHSTTIRAVLVEVSRDPALRDAMQHQFLDQRKALIELILQQAVDRGEIDDATISDELWDLLPCYLIFRSIIPNRPPLSTPCRFSSTPSSSPASLDPSGKTPHLGGERRRGGCALRDVLSRAVPYRTVPSYSGRSCSTKERTRPPPQRSCHRLSKG
jgi:AcrR family transcriptional regulator